MSKGSYILLALFVLALAACGKNEALFPIAQQPYGQSPYGQSPYGQSPYGQPYGQSPYGPMYQAPGYGAPGYPSNYTPGYGYLPGYGNNGYYPGGFAPQMPSGYPSAYTPFLPVDYYMRNNPQLAPQWPQIWNQWRNYANNYGYNPYDFNRFWFDYCPRSNMSPQIYIYLDQTFYPWVNTNTVFPANLNPQYFWIHYQGY